DGVVLGGGGDLAAMEGPVPKSDGGHRSADIADSIIFEDIAGDETLLHKRRNVDGPPIDRGEPLAVGQMGVHGRELCKTLGASIQIDEIYGRASFDSLFRSWADVACDVVDRPERPHGTVRIDMFLELAWHRAADIV